MSEASETFELVLDPPIKVRGGEFHSLSLTEPRARQVRDAEKKLDLSMSEASVDDYKIALVSAVAGVSEDVAGKLLTRQMGEAYGFLAGFIDDPYAGEPEEGDDLPNDGTEVPIDPPLTWNKGSYPALTLHEPTAEQLRNARNRMRGGTTPYTVRCYQMELLRLVTELPPAVIDGLRIRTLTEATRQLTRFIVAGQKAGKRSSLN